MDDLRQLELGVVRLEAAHRSERNASRRLVLITTIASGALVATVLGFAWINYSFFRTEWTEAKFTKHAQAEVAALEPAIQRQLARLTERLGPVYSAEFRRQLPSKLPAISARVRDQFDRFGQDLQTDLYHRLHGAEDRVRTKLSMQVLASYPTMHSAAHRHMVQERMGLVAKEAVGTAIDRFQTRFAQDIIELQGVVGRFRGRAQDKSTLDLQKHFIRLWLQLLDEEIRRL